MVQAWNMLLLLQRNVQVWNILLLMQCNVPYSSAVPLPTLRNNVVGLLHRLEMDTSDCDWLTVVRALHVSHCEFRHMGYPQPFLLQCLAKALPSLLRLNPR